MAVNLSTLVKPVDDQVIDVSTGVMRDEWKYYFQDLTKALNLAVGELGSGAAPTDAAYIVGASNATLSAERVATNSTSNAWNLGVAGQAAVERAALTGDVSAAANSNTVTVNKVTGFPVSTSGDRWGIVPLVGTDGLMEIGRYLDFHNSDADVTDYANRLETNGGVVGLYERPNAGAIKRLVSLTDSTLAQGDVIYFDGTDFVRLAKGADGQFLRQGATIPAWANGGWTTIEEGSVAAVASKDFTSLGTYDELELDILNLVPATDNVAVNMHLRQSGSFVTAAGSYQHSSTRGNAGTMGGRQSPSDTEIGLIDAAGNNTNETLHFHFKFYRHSEASVRKQLTWNGGGRLQNGTIYNIIGYAELISNTNAIDGFRILFGSGNIASMYYVLRGRNW